MLPWKLRRRQILPVNQNIASVHFRTELCRRVLCAPIPIHEFFSYPEPTLILKTIQYDCTGQNFDREVGVQIRKVKVFIVNVHNT